MSDIIEDAQRIIREKYGDSPAREILRSMLIDMSARDFHYRGYSMIELDEMINAYKRDRTDHVVRQNAHLRWALHLLLRKEQEVRAYIETCTESDVPGMLMSVLDDIKKLCEKVLGE